MHTFNFDDTTDSRDVIKAFESLYSLLDSAQYDEDEAALEGDESYEGIHFDEWVKAVAQNEEHEYHDEAEDYLEFKRISDWAEHYCSEWNYGTAIIKESYMQTYAEEFLKDCYGWPPEGVDTSQWPYNHLTMDFEGMVEEWGSDFNEIEIDGNNYWVRG